MKEKLPQEVQGRWPTAAAIKRINSLLSISENQYSQDWEFEISDPERLCEYLDAYEHKLYNDDEKFALMSVIIDAFEYRGLDEETWSRIRQHLKTDFALHEYTIHYWCCMDAEDADLSECWNILPWMRELWNECKSNQT